MVECIKLLGDAAVLTTLECDSRYWQIEIAKVDKIGTTFTSQPGLFGLIKKQFGLKTAPVTFQQAVEILLSRVK